MQPFETVVMRRLLKLDSGTRASYEAAAASLKAERTANPPGPGNLRTLKKRAEKDAMVGVYEELGRGPQAGRKYDQVYARVKGITTRD